MGPGRSSSRALSKRRDDGSVKLSDSCVPGLDLLAKLNEYVVYSPPEEQGALRRLDGVFGT